MSDGSHERRQRTRQILSGETCASPASVFDPLSARAAEELGYEFAMLAGSSAALTILGAPDLALLTLTELADQARRIGRASNLPLLVDADHGYGNALNVVRTVEELEAAGVAALTIEDTLLPQRHGAPDAELISPEEATGKMRAAVSGRRDPALVIVARTGALRMTNVADAIARARAYADCGVDALFFTGVTSRSELNALAAASSLPLMIGSPSKELADERYLASRNVRIVLQGHAPLLAAADAAYQTLKAQQARERVDTTVAARLVKTLAGELRYQQLQEDFLGTPKGRK